MDQALENMGKRLPSEDVKMFVTSVNILRETGGNIAETFDTITTTIRERLKLKNKIDAMTAQGKMSALIVGSLPWMMFGLLYMIDAKFMTPLLVTPIGWLIMSGVIALEIAGFVVINKIVQIKV
jgi:tight adherence protein B